MKSFLPHDLTDADRCFMNSSYFTPVTTSVLWNAPLVQTKPHCDGRNLEPPFVPSNISARYGKVVKIEVDDTLIPTELER